MSNMRGMRGGVGREANYRDKTILEISITT